jgi:hypothetical protein
MQGFTLLCTSFVLLSPLKSSFVSFSFPSLPLPSFLSQNTFPFTFRTDKSSRWKGRSSINFGLRRPPPSFLSFFFFLLALHFPVPLSSFLSNKTQFIVFRLSPVAHAPTHLPPQDARLAQQARQWCILQEREKKDLASGAESLRSNPSNNTQ